MNLSSPRRGLQAGVTLLELLIVMAIIGLIAGVSFPSVAAGLESIQLRSAADGVATFLTSAMTRADRREQAIEIVISPSENALSLLSSEPGYTRRFELENGIHLSGDKNSEFLLLPGGTAPAISIDIYNNRGVHKVIRVDPVTGVPQVSSS